MSAINGLASGLPFRFATFAKLIMSKYFGVGTLGIHGYDYHDSSRITGEQQDYKAGRILGSFLKYANEINSNLVVYVITDGGVTPNRVANSSARPAPTRPAIPTISPLCKEKFNS